jgi:hypothetical protein
MSMQTHQSQETATSAIAHLIAQLALPEAADGLNAALGKIQGKVDSLERLSHLRATAKALLDLHQRVPYLQKAILSVAHQITDQGSDYTFSLDHCEFIAGSTPADRSVDELTQQLEDAIHMPIPSARPAPVTEAIDIFAYWPEMFFNAVLGEPTLEATATVETTRDVVLEAHDLGGYDEIIRAVLPCSWNELAVDLGLPMAQDNEPTRPRPRA